MPSEVLESTGGQSLTGGGPSPFPLSEPQTQMADGKKVKNRKIKQSERTKKMTRAKAEDRERVNEKNGELF